MPRVARTVIAGAPHHVTQRGNNREDVFFTDDDRHFYLSALKRVSAEAGLKIHAYCLMSNHLHIVATPDYENSIASTLARTHLIYTQHINRLHDRSGHLWQNRFYSCPVEDNSFPVVVRYVECNPVRAKMEKYAWRYEWSSAAAHCGLADLSGLLDLYAWTRTYPPSDWKEYLREKENELSTDLIRVSTNRGRPLGSDNFISKLEELTGRKLHPLPHGHPRKTED